MTPLPVSIRSDSLAERSEFELLVLLKIPCANRAEDPRTAGVFTTAADEIRNATRTS